MNLCTRPSIGFSPESDNQGISPVHRFFITFHNLLFFFCVCWTVLGAFAKLRKRLLSSACLSVLPSFRMSVCPSVRPSFGMEQLGSYCADFHEICHLTIFRKFFEKSHLLLTLILPTWRIWWAPNNASKSQMEFNSGFQGLTYDSNNEDFTWRSISFFICLAQFFLE